MRNVSNTTVYTVQSIHYLRRSSAIVVGFVHRVTVNQLKTIALFHNTIQVVVLFVFYVDVYICFLYADLPFACPMVAGATLTCRVTKPRRGSVALGMCISFLLRGFWFS